MALRTSGGYVDSQGFRFSNYYWNKLWSTGRGAPGLVARDVLAGAAGNGAGVSGMPGFYRYVYGGWELIYNPVTREVWHLMPTP
jgi:filamentous hemagglutinin